MTLARAPRPAPRACRRSVRSLVRAVGFLASFVAVVAGCVALVGWLDKQDVPLWVLGGVIVGIGLALFLIRILFVPREDRAFAAWLDDRIWQLLLWCAIFAVAVVAVVVGFGGLDLVCDLVTVVGAAVAFALAVGRLVWDLYARDKASRKECPDCCEDVKVGASVCRYCGHRWTDAQGGLTAPPRLSGCSAAVCTLAAGAGRRPRREPAHPAASTRVARACARRRQVRLPELWRAARQTRLPDPAICGLEVAPGRA